MLDVTMVSKTFRYLAQSAMHELRKNLILRGTRFLSAFLIVSLNIFSSSLAGQADQVDASFRPRVALAMAGGGTRGVAHIGVLRVLQREGIPIDCIAGTSIGAIVGGLYAAGVPLEKIESIFRTKSILRHFDTVPISVRVALIPALLLPRLIGIRPYDGLYRGGIFRNFLSDLPSPDKRNLEDLKHPVFWAVCSNLLDGYPYVIKEGNLGTALQASSAIPLLRRPVDYGDALLVDGGIVENLPVTEARKMGCDFVIAIDIDQAVPILPKKDFRKFGSVSKRSINMNLRALDQPQVKAADLVIAPDLGDIGLLSHSLADANRAIKAGEAAAEKAVPTIRAELERLRKARSMEEHALAK
jgi:NTE family protein